MLVDFVNASFTESRVERAHDRLLATGEAREGLLRVAVAAALTRRPHLATPTIATGGGGNLVSSPIR